MMPYGIIGLGNKTPQSGQLSMHHGGGMSQSGGGLGIGGMGGGSSANLYGEGLQQARQQQVWAAQHDALYKKQKEAASFTTPHAAVWQQQAHQHPSQQQPQAVRKFQHFNDSAMVGHLRLFPFPSVSRAHTLTSRQRQLRTMQLQVANSCAIDSSPAIPLPTRCFKS